MTNQLKTLVTDALRAHGMSQTQYCQAHNLPRPSLSRYLNGTIATPPYICDFLSETLAIDRAALRKAAAHAAPSLRIQFNDHPPHIRSKAIEYLFELGLVD